MQRQDVVDTFFSTAVADLRTRNSIVQLDLRRYSKYKASPWVKGEACLFPFRGFKCCRSKLQAYYSLQYHIKCSNPANSKCVSDTVQNSNISSTLMCVL